MAVGSGDFEVDEVDEVELDVLFPEFPELVEFEEVELEEAEGEAVPEVAVAVSDWVSPELLLLVESWW